jgi:hypothetical protein
MTPTNSTITPSSAHAFLQTGDMPGLSGRHERNRHTELHTIYFADSRSVFSRSFKYFPNPDQSSFRIDSRAFLNSSSAREFSPA